MTESNYAKVRGENILRDGDSLVQSSTSEDDLGALEGQNDNNNDKNKNKKRSVCQERSVSGESIWN